MRGIAAAEHGKSNSRRRPLGAALSQTQDTTTGRARKEGGLFILSEVGAGANTDEFSRHAKYDLGRGSMGR